MADVAADLRRNDGARLVGGLAPARPRPVSTQPRWLQSMVSCSHRMRGLAPISTNRAATGTAWVPPLRLSRGVSLSGRPVLCPPTASVCRRTEMSGWHRHLEGLGRHAHRGNRSMAARCEDRSGVGTLLPVAAGNAVNPCERPRGPE